MSWHSNVCSHWLRGLSKASSSGAFIALKCVDDARVDRVGCRGVTRLRPSGHTCPPQSLSNESLVIAKPWIGKLSPMQIVGQC